MFYITALAQILVKAAASRSNHKLILFQWYSICYLDVRLLVDVFDSLAAFMLPKLFALAL